MSRGTDVTGSNGFNSANVAKCPIMVVTFLLALLSAVLHKL
jgi:hypothetical protein